MKKKKTTRRHGEDVNKFNNLEVRDTKAFNELFKKSMSNDQFTPLYSDIEIKEIVNDINGVIRVIECDGKEMTHRFDYISDEFKR